MCIRDRAKADPRKRSAGRKAKRDCKEPPYASGGISENRDDSHADHSGPCGQGDGAERERDARERVMMRCRSEHASEHGEPHEQRGEPQRDAERAQRRPVSYTHLSVTGMA